MQTFYYVKTDADLFGVPNGSVERFFEHRAVALLREGKIEPFDPKRHANAPGAKDAMPPEQTIQPIKR